MLHKSELVTPLKDKAVQCLVCEHRCALKPGEWGKCGVRTNRDGEVYLTVYGNAIAAHLDPIEKKPLYHFLPGTRALSIGTYGCNMQCRWCQNWRLSQTREHAAEADAEELLPSKLVDIALRNDIASIAYTYNEPTVFFEYTYDTARLAHEHDVKNVYVSNGFMTPEMLDRLVPYLDGINVDLKGFTEEFYRTYTGARLEPVKRNIAHLAKDTRTWVEVTTLVIPDLNDSDEGLEEMASWLAEVDPFMPWHLSAFYPTHEMTDRLLTPRRTLERAYQIGKEAGLHYVYVGNVNDPERSSTRCHNCGTLLIERFGYRPRTHWDEPGVCQECGTHNPGVWIR
jgi:pyruvate formate lyase activating enzyme